MGDAQLRFKKLPNNSQEISRTKHSASAKMYVFWLKTPIRCDLLVPFVVNQFPAEDNLGAPNVTSLLTEVAGSSAYGTCLGAMASFGAMARVLGPIVFASLYEDVHHSAPWISVAVLGTLAHWFGFVGKDLGVSHMPKTLTFRSSFCKHLVLCPCVLQPLGTRAGAR